MIFLFLEVAPLRSKSYALASDISLIVSRSNILAAFFFIELSGRPARAYITLSLS
jgi:hypothetical protein